MNLGLLPLGHNVHRLALDATAVQVTSGLIHAFEAAFRRVRRVAVYGNTQDRMASVSSKLCHICIHIWAGPYFLEMRFQVIVYYFEHIINVLFVLLEENM